MNRKSLYTAVSIAVLGLAALAGAFAIAGEAKDKTPAGQSEAKLPPGLTDADMEACMKAAIPGKAHQLLARDAGVWRGKSTMWVSPEADPITTECTTTSTPIFDGRFIKHEMAGEMPGMGPYTGLAISGYDNVTQELVSTWIDNFGTGMAVGTGKISEDGKTITWKYSYNCPIQKKPVVMRQVETGCGTDAKVIEAFAAFAKTGKEYKMMRLEMARKK